MMSFSFTNLNNGSSSGEKKLYSSESKHSKIHDLPESASRSIFQQKAHNIEKEKECLIKFKTPLV